MTDDARSFFVSAEGSSTSATIPTLGHARRTCDRCGADWGPTSCSASACDSMQFTTRYVEPVPLSTRVLDRLRPKPQPPRATAAQTSALRDFAVSLEHFRTELAQVDELLRAGVADGVEELQPAHNIFHQATYTTGDTSLESVRFLSLGLRSLSAALPGAIEVLETP